MATCAGVRLALTPSAVQVAVHEPSERLLVPGVDEVRVAGELATRRELGAGSGDRVVDQQGERGHLHRMRGGTHAVRRVGHVALVIGAIEIRAVPTVREVDLQAERGTERAPRRARRDRRRDATTVPAAPRRDRKSLRRPCGRRARDHLQVGGERLHGVQSAADVVDGGVLGLDGATVHEQGRRPVRSCVCTQATRRLPGGAQRLRRRGRIRRVVPEVRVVVGTAGLIEVDDRIVLIAVAEAAGDREVAAPSAVPAPSSVEGRDRLRCGSARSGRRRGERGSGGNRGGCRDEEKREPASQSVHLHVQRTPSMGTPSPRGGARAM
jgi:hypothetical protein